MNINLLSVGKNALVWARRLPMKRKYIYFLSFPSGEVVYVGQTDNLIGRMKVHSSRFFSGKGCSVCYLEFSAKYSKKKCHY